MAAKNLGKSQGSFEQAEKISSTLKRHPKMELSKPDLLQLLGVLEGELQAREIVIAVLKAEQVKQLLYPKRKSAATNDPWAALQRDCLGAFDATFDETAVKHLCGMQLSQLENFLKQHKLAQMKLREQLEDAEKRCEKLLRELEEEKQKHAQDTAQGDDVTYLLEKERERLHQENQFEKQQNRCMEKDIKCLTETLEQERQRQKQIVLLLLAERKRIIYRYAEEKQKSDRLSQILCDEKGRIADMVDGLEEESKKSLQMEAELERQLCEFEVERDQYKIEINELETKNSELVLEVQKLQEEVETLQKHITNSSLTQAQLGEGVRSTIVTMVSTPPLRAVPTISPTVSPPRGVARALSPKVGPAPATPAKPPGLIPQTPGKVSGTGTVKPAGPSFPANSVSPLCSPPLVAPQNVKKVMKPGSPATILSPSASDEIGSLLQVSTATQQYVDNASPESEKSITNDQNNPLNAKIYSSIKVSTAVPVHKPAMATALSAPSSKKLPVGRGTPPPIPPNKPILPPQSLHRKDASTKPPVPPRSDAVSENSSDKNPLKANPPMRFVAPPKSNSDDLSVNVISSKDEFQVGVNDAYNSTGMNKDLSTENLGSEVLVQELADFQNVLVSMASSNVPESH